MSDLSPDTPPIEVTHILDGKLLIQKLDKNSRPFYLDAETGRIAALKGKIPDLLETPKPLTAETDPTHVSPEVLALLADDGCPNVPEHFGDIADVPGILPFDVYAIAVAAFANPYGTMTRGAISARVCAERECALTFPDHDGNDRRCILSFPRGVDVIARPYDLEE